MSGDGNAARIGPIKSKSYRRGRLKTPSPIIDFSHRHRTHIYVQGRSNGIATAPAASSGRVGDHYESLNEFCSSCLVRLALLRSRLLSPTNQSPFFLKRSAKRRSRNRLLSAHTPAPDAENLSRVSSWRSPSLSKKLASRSKSKGQGRSGQDTKS